MAHRCWAVDEIVRAIAAELVKDRRNASAVALASCSKSLTEPALAEVWRSLSSLVPLVKCFPPDVWEFRVVGDRRSLFFKRCPLHAEWTRFQRWYASKVQYLAVFYPNSIISLDVLHILQLSSAGCPLLPNILSLTWGSDEKEIPFISSFISLSLVSIFINVPAEATLILPPIFNKLSTSDNRLREIMIELRRPVDDSSMEEATSHLLMHCKHRLRKFRVSSPISASALRHVIQLPSLEEFYLTVNSFQLPDPLPILVFPCLRKLFVECNGIRDLTWLKILPAIENPVLTTITVKCPGSEVERFMETFQLTMTGITGCAMRKCLQELTVKSPDGFKVTPQIIASSCSFRNLTVLDLDTEDSDICLTPDLTDEHIDLLTKAMPCLESLFLGEYPCGVPSHITFKSLYNISSRCTQLTNLRIHFNPALFVARVCKEESWDVALDLPDLKTLSSNLCSIEYIMIGEIPLPAHPNASCIMALGLLGVFPCLIELNCDDDSEWTNVDKLIRVYRRLSHFGKD